MVNICKLKIDGGNVILKYLSGERCRIKPIQPTKIKEFIFKACTVIPQNCPVLLLYSFL